MRPRTATLRLDPDLAGTTATHPQAPHFITSAPREPAVLLGSFPHPARLTPLRFVRGSDAGDPFKAITSLILPARETTVKIPGDPVSPPPNEP